MRNALLVVLAALVLAVPVVVWGQEGDRDGQGGYPQEVLERYWECMERNDLNQIRELVWYHHNVARIDASIYGLPADDFDDRSDLTIEERYQHRAAKAALAGQRGYVPMATSGPVQYAHHLREALDHYYESTGLRPDCSAILAEAGLSGSETEAMGSGWAADLNLTSTDSVDRGEVNIVVDFANPNRLTVSSCPSGSTPDSSSNFIAYSSNWGQSWTRTAVGNNSGSTWECDPVSYYQRSTGRVYHSKIGCNTGMCSSTYTMMRYSANNGSSWADCGRPGAQTSEDRQWHVVDNTVQYDANGDGVVDTNNACYGNIYITWHNSNQETVARSTDNCATWVNRTTLTSTYQAITPDINAAANGHVYAVWQNHGDATFKIAGSSNCGQTWNAPSAKTVKARLGDWSNDIPAQCQRGIATQPLVDVDRAPRSDFYGRVYVAMLDFNQSGCGSGPGCTTWDTACNYDIWFTSSDNNGSTFSTPVNLTAGEGNRVDHFMGYMRVDESDGSIYISYHRTRLNPTALVDRQKTHEFVMRSTDGGATWANYQASTLEGDERLSGASTFERGDYNSLDVYQGVVWPVWIDRRNSSGVEEVITRKICTEPSHWSERSPTFAAPTTTVANGSGAGNVDISWTPPDIHWGDGGEDTTARKYQLWVDGSLAQDNIAWTATSVGEHNIGNCNSHSYVIRAVNQCGVYKDYAVRSFAATNCCANNPTSVNVTPNGPLTLCQGTGQLLTATPTGGTAPFTFEWYRDGALIGGASGSTYTANDTGNHVYNCEVTGSGCSTGTMDSAPTQLTWQTVPTFAGLESVTAPPAATCTLTLGWSPATSACSNPITYSVYRSTDPAFTPGLANRIATGLACGGSTCSYTDSDSLVSGTTYYYVVRATDAVHGEEPNTVRRSGTPIGLTGDATWQTGAEPGNPSMWTGGTGAGWTISSARKHLGTYSFFSQSANGTCDFLRTPPLQLTGGQASLLTYWTAYDIESRYDGGVVEISVGSDGGPWTVLTPTPGYPGTFRLSSDACGYATNQPCYTGTALTFTQYTVNLAAYNDPTPGTNVTVYIRWNLSTDGSLVNEGWYVDDISVTHVQTNTPCTTGTSCTNPVAPVVTGSSDADPCAQSGIRVSYTPSTTPGVRHDLVRDGVVVVTGYASGALYEPGDTANHTYAARAVISTCFTDSNSRAQADANGTPEAPGAPTVTDLDPCAQTGVQVTWVTVSGATSYDLWVDGVTLVSGVTSPYNHNPGDTATHTYQVRGRNAACTGGWSAATGLADAAGLGAPAAPTVADVSLCAQTGVLVSWGAVAGATGYDLRVDGATVVVGVTSPYTHLPGSSDPHGYQVRATNASCSSPWSVSTSGNDVNDTPATPSALSASATAPNRVDLSWSGSAAAYQVLRSTSSGGPYGLVGTTATTSYSDPSVSAGTTYYYVVRGESGSGCVSADSSEAAATAVGVCTSPPSFGGLVSAGAVSGDCAIRLQWDAATPNCGTTVVYNVYRGTSSGFTPGPTNLLASCVAALSLDDTSVAVDQAYHYVVRAEDGAGNGTGPCASGNQDGNLVERTATVSSVSEAGGQTPSPISTTTSNPVTADFSPAFTVETATFAEVGYGLTFTPVETTETLATPSFEAPKNATTTRTLTPSPSTSTTPVTSAEFRYTVTKFTASVTNARLVCDTNVIELSRPQSNNVPVIDDVTAFYNSNGLCSYQFEVVIGNQVVPFVNVALTISKVGAGDVATNSQVQLLGPGGGVWTLKGYGSNPLPPIPVTSSYNSAGGGPGIWRIRLTENAGGEARLSGATMSVNGTLCTLAGAEPLSFFTATVTGTSSFGQAKLEWVTPSAGACTGVRILRKEGAFPSGPGDATAVLVSGGERPCGGAGVYGTVDDTGLTNGTTYFYAAYVNGGGNWYSGARTVKARPQDTTLTVPGSVKWVYNTGATALTPPGLGSLFGVSNDRVLHGMVSGASGGSWPRPGWAPMVMNAPAQGRPSVLEPGINGVETVVLGSQDGYVYAVDATTGSELWHSPLTGDFGLVQATPSGIFTDYGGAVDLILVGTRNAGQDNAFYGIAALGSGDREPAWSYDGAPVGGIGIISGDAWVEYTTPPRVYFASRERSAGSGTLWCLTFGDSSAAPCSGSWPVALGDVDGGPVVRGGTVYLGNNAGVVYAVNATTGAVIWSHATGDGPVKGFVWADWMSDDLYVSTTERVWSLQDATPHERWSTDVAGRPSAPLVVGSEVVVGSTDGRVHRLQASDGVEIGAPGWQLGDGGAAVGSPTYEVGTGLVYVGSESGAVYAVRLTGSGEEAP